MLATTCQGKLMRRRLLINLRLDHCLVISNFVPLEKLSYARAVRMRRFKIGQAGHSAATSHFCKRYSARLSVKGPL